MKYAPVQRLLVLVGLAGLVGVLMFLPSRLELADNDLRTARESFETRILRDSFEPLGPVPTPPEGVFDRVTYPGPAGDMEALVTPDPGDGARHPAVIWLSGGYGGIGDWFWTEQPPANDQSARAFREAGLVMMVPSFRGENANPGHYEMFYGDLDDLEAARAWLAGRDWVDPDRIYLAGHSTGGTRALLGNEYVDGFRAAFSIGGIADLKQHVRAGGFAARAPFDDADDTEFLLRSPGYFLRSVKSPTFHFEGAQDWVRTFEDLNELAEQESIPFQAFRIHGADHFSVIHPVTRMLAQKILKDTGDQTDIAFTEDDIREIVDTVRP
ncbi:prolyl oligopeptidase family serine peptidase [Phaeovibrio sulfidiphilus]|uniref:Prolyl oligopeptidase family serine peptidase n=1 Tax=Phaeovibrio sulfidiphilus TaxID=1220600 RepID=A0A8J6YUL8_9PROT|nr:CocE/NonD family hydrolase [Phaeovibrio sulfidiphilus]MBE1236719.1 prolyl oligopeptidase family serine peptidase [Phaeovibrio sulfidiphilus]